jgi:hypothetical protein
VARASRSGTDKARLERRRRGRLRGDAGARECVRFGGLSTLHEGCRRTERYDDEPAISPDRLRARVGAMHLPLGLLLQALLDAGFQLERLDELGAREYPYSVALGCRRSRLAPPGA